MLMTEQTLGAEAIVREGDEAFARYRRLIEERGQLPCVVRHPDAGGQCQGLAVMKVYGLNFCEIHGAEAKAGALEEIYFDAVRLPPFSEASDADDRVYTLARRSPCPSEPTSGGSLSWSLYRASGPMGLAPGGWRRRRRVLWALCVYCVNAQQHIIQVHPRPNGRARGGTGPGIRGL
jgi:hypothetical protein